MPKLTPGTMRALEVLQNQTEPMTLKQLNEGLEEPIAVAHLTALKRAELVTTEKVEVPVTRMEKVNTYVLDREAVSNFKFEE